jgi:hypothetical protein
MQWFEPMGGSRLPCRGQEAPQSALAAVLSKAARTVNGLEDPLG